MNNQSATSIPNSRLDIFFGPMCSGKSTLLMSKLTNFAVMGLKVLYINNLQDTRSVSDFSTHSTIVKPDSRQVQTVRASRLVTDIGEIALHGINVAEFDVIGIDEAQFFGPDLVLFTHRVVEDLGKYVIISGLDGDRDRQRFGYILDLVPFADHVTKLRAFCTPCSEKRRITEAPFTHYTGTPSTAQVIVGGVADGKYEPVCRDCYLRRT